jgi:hypothetical protein
LFICSFSIFYDYFSIENSFLFNVNDILKLGLFPSQHDLFIQVGNSFFKCSLEQLVSQSPLSLSNFIESTWPFHFDLPSDLADSYVSSFAQLDSLFHFFTKLLLTPQNVNFFPSIADALDISS